MIPITVLTRKVFLDDQNYSYVTEPMNLNGFKRARMALTVHGLGTDQSGVVTFEHCGVPETSQDANWTTLTPTTNPAGLSEKGVNIYVIDNFLPWVRMTVGINSSAASGTLRIGEVSLNGHAFENTD